MAKLTDVYKAENVKIGRRQIPVGGGDSSLMLLMDLNSKGLVIDSPHIRGKELEEFTRKFNLLTGDELRCSLEIDSATFISLLNQCVQCVGCRRRVERLFNQLTTSGHPTLDPLVLNSSRILTVNEEKLKTPQALGTLLYRHHEVLNNLLDNKLRNKTRCVLHSLDAFRSKPFSETWREVWSSMKQNCREELTVIETKELHEVLENYLKKHKFCQGCRTKIEKAYKILVGETTSKEKGFVAALYSNIKKCQVDKHIHITTNKVDFLDALIRRAEPEVNGSYSKQRERHAKTLEIAQEEVLTCVGMIMFERLRRIYVSLREEERACQVLAAVGVHALCRSFDMAVEKKQGISNLELLYKEISRAEKAKELKREQKKLKKKQKKIEKKNTHRPCVSVDNDVDSDTADGDEEQEDEAVDLDDYIEEITEVDTQPSMHCNEHHMVGDLTCSSADEKVDVDLVDGTYQPSHAQKTKKRKPKQKQGQKKTNNNNNNKKAGQSLLSTITGRNVTESSKTTTGKCDTCLEPARDCPCENDVKDSGYGSEPTSHDNSRTSSVASSPEGSEVSCSDGFCNHDQTNEAHDLDDEHTMPLFSNFGCETLYCGEPRLNWPSLQQMLEGCDGSDYEDEDDCYIPQEVVLEYQFKYEKVQRQREQLRETLRQNFSRFCMQRGFLSADCCK